MSKKRYIDDGFWTDPYVEKLDLMEKGLFLYLLTNPLCNIAGIYEVSMKRLAYETGLDVEIASTMLDRFVRDNKISRVENWLIIWNFGKHQVLNPSVESGVRRIWGELPKNIQAVTGCDRLSYFTLLNLTIPNAENEVVLEETFKTNFKTPKIKIDKLTGKLKLSNKQQEQIQKVINLFSTYSGGVYNDPLNTKAIAGLIQQHGIDIVLSVAEFALKLKPKEFQVVISQPIDLAQKWSKVVDLMEKPKDSKYGITY